MIITRTGCRIDKKEINEDMLGELRKELTVTPNIDTDYEKDEDIKFPVFIENENFIFIPKFYGIKKFGKMKSEILSKTSIFSFSGKLREYQIPIIDECLKKIKKNGGGILSVPCGFGKTTMALYIAHILQAKTLILVHKTFLQDQWIDRIKKFTNASIGIIRQNKVVTNCDIVVGMVESISYRDYDSSIFDDFKLVIYDEVHHLGSKVFSKALLKTGATYTLGLSATPIRSDGMTKIIKWFVGDILYKQEMKKDTNVIVKSFEFNTNTKLFTEKKRTFKGKIKINIPLTINMLCKNNERTQHIINIISGLRQNSERKMIILSDRINLLKKLKESIDKIIENEIKEEKIEENEWKTYYYTGDMKQKSRKEAEMNADILFATYGMAKEALDIERLNTIIFATPQKNVIQSIGRIMRKTSNETGKDFFSGIKPLIIDFSDFLPIFSHHKEKRIGLYKKNLYKIRYYYFYNDKLVDKKTYAEKTFENELKIKNDYKPDLNNILLDTDSEEENEDEEDEPIPIPKFIKLDEEIFSEYMFESN